MTRPRVAIAHDYLTQRGGAERVVLALHRAFPEATIHTTLYDPDGTYPEFRDARIETSPLNKVGRLRRSHRAALPFLAPASSRLRIDADVVVASSSGWAHGFAITGRRLVYCHAPARWLYQPVEYLGGPPYSSARGLALAAMRPFLLRWDRRAAARGRPLPLQLAGRARADRRGLRDHRRGGAGPGRHRHLGPHGGGAGARRTGPTATCSSSRGCCRTRTSTASSRRSGGSTSGWSWSGRSRAGVAERRCCRGTPGSSATSPTARCAGCTPMPGRSSPPATRTSA